MARYPIKDQVAIVGVGTTPYMRDRGRSNLAMAIEASKNALLDSGMKASDIDGVAGSQIMAHQVAPTLGIPRLRWWANVQIPFTQQVLEAMHAIYSGACETVLAFHSTYRSTGTSRSAAGDPFRSRSGPGMNILEPNPDSIANVTGYAAWASRYIYEYNAKREDFGLAAINSRSNASLNEHAVLRHHMSMDDYLAGRMIRDPLCIYDMDYPVDGADAVIITTAERAKDLPGKPVLIHAATLGMPNHPEEEQMESITKTGQQVVMDALWERSDLKLNDMDLFYPYDGFTIITLRWIESVGYCGNGEAGDFMRENWDTETDRLQLNGSVLVNTHGGSLSDGGTQGSGHIREAVLQLRGAAGSHQAPESKTALVVTGGFFFNAGGLILRTE